MSRSQFFGLVAWRCSLGFILYFIHHRPHSYTCHCIHSVHFQAAYRAHQSWQHLDGYSKHGTFPWSPGSSPLWQNIYIAAAAQTKPFVYESVWKWLNITENGCKVSTKTRPLFASKLPKLEGLRPRRKDRTKKPLPPLLNLWFTTKFIKFIVIRAFLNSKGLFPGWDITMYNRSYGEGLCNWTGHWPWAACERQTNHGHLCLL